MLFLPFLLAGVVPVSAVPSQDVSDCHAAKGIDEHPAYPYDSFSVFEFSVAGSQFRIQANGLGSRRSGSRPLQRFHLRLNDEYLSQRLFFCDLGADLLIVAEASDGDGANGFVFRIERGNLTTRWRQVVPGFNVAQPVKDGRTVYVSGIGFIGAIDLLSGKYKWRHSNLYDAGEFNEFAPAVLNGNLALFREPAHSIDSAIAVDIGTGQIVRPDYVRKRASVQDKRP